MKCLIQMLSACCLRPMVLIIAAITIFPFPALSMKNDLPPSSTTTTIQTLPLRDLAIELGGIFHTDYRMYTGDERADNQFHIRRTQLELTTWIYKQVRLKLQGYQ